MNLSTILSIPTFVSAPEDHLCQIKCTYRQLQLELPLLRGRLRILAETTYSSGPEPDQLYKLLQLESTCIFLLSYALILNAVLMAVDPQNITLYSESQGLALEAITISQQTAAHLPAGMGFIPYALFAAWVATDNTEIMKGIASTMAMSDVYFADAKYVLMFRALKTRLQALREKTQVALVPSGAPLSETVQRYMILDLPDNPWV